MARKSFLFVLIGCGHVSVSGGEPLKESEQSVYERQRDIVLRNVYRNSLMLVCILEYLLSIKYCREVF